ncbi:MAG: type II toxin-antitoxin system MqsA family antitoxin [Selenomonadaceae bacterium]|nr:type II toxin-antitoxin system MqsA family antitoxin [Selenomonadaceae bacterium]
MNCLICKGGKMIEGFETYFAKLGDSYLIIENVPCFKCDQCGELVFSLSVLEKLEKLIELYEKVQSKIFIVDYRQAA